METSLQGSFYLEREGKKKEEGRTSRYSSAEPERSQSVNGVRKKRVLGAACRAKGPV